ncbi:hypothetical protein OOT00_08720 [Desulfobotulus sp. H1]|uniref:HAMP domain-containing protein n=1 Tax=Desulfobotulus pelophilus TaxID=2823377 RepID=A0ABT3N9D1_9BACT|nr:hypothetical protein [Desulfobotulus pelophilus]MCW7754068.1 hypothetical protein [Desulfobotulus pelophilus]
MFVEKQQESSGEAGFFFRNLMKGIFRRRRFFLFPAFQLSLTWRILMLMMLAVGITATIDAWFYLVFLDQKLIIHVNMAYLNTFIVILLAVLIGGAIWTVRLTHQIAGPIHQSIGMLEKAADNGRQRVCFRKNDLLQELAQPVNSALALLNEQSLRIRHTRKDLENLLDEMVQGQAASEDVQQEIRRAIRSLNGE